MIHFSLPKRTQHRAPHHHPAIFPLSALTHHHPAIFPSSALTHHHPAIFPLSALAHHHPALFPLSALAHHHPALFPLSALTHHHPALFPSSALALLPLTALTLFCLSSCKPEGNTYKFDPGTKPGGNIITPTSKPSVIDGARLKGQLELADPFVFVDRKDSLYYAFGTANAQKGFKPYVSDDLTNWILGNGRASEGFSLYKTDVTVTSGGTTYSGSDYWAPELYQFGDTYYMYYTSAEHVYVAKSDSPLGPFKQTSTGFTPNAKGIDNSIFVDDDGKTYMYWVRFDGGNVIYCAEMEPSRTAIKSSTMKFCFRATQAWELDWGKINEGPGVIKHNGKYYMVYSGNHYQSQNYGVGVATATNPLGPWTKCSYNPILQKPGALVGTGHCAVFTDLKGNLKMIFHAHPSTAAYSPRQTYITDLTFETVGGQERLVASPNYTALRLYTR